MSGKRSQTQTPQNRNVRRDTNPTPPNIHIPSPPDVLMQSPGAFVIIDDLPQTPGAIPLTPGGVPLTPGGVPQAPGAGLQMPGVSAWVAQLPIEYQTHYQNNPIPNLDDEDYLLAYQQYSHYKFMNQLGSGTFSNVYEVEIEMNNTKFRYAIKVIKSSNDIPYNEHNQPNDFDFGGYLQENPHSNIIVISFFYRSDDWLRYYIVTEMAETDLYEAVKEVNANGVKTWKPLNENSSRYLIRGIAQGVQHLHSLGLAHCDIKLENILLFPIGVTEDKQQFITKFFRFIPKLSDFGQMREFDTNNANDPNRFCDEALCTIDTAAPESWFTTKKYDVVRADAFSVGTVLLSLLLGAQPFSYPRQYTSSTGHILTSEQLCNDQKKNIIFTENLCKSFRIPLKQVLLRLLDPNPQNRLSIPQFLTDVWISDKIPSKVFEDSYRPLQKQRFMKEI